MAPRPVGVAPEIRRRIALSHEVVAAAGPVEPARHRVARAEADVLVLVGRDEARGHRHAAAARPGHVHRHRAVSPPVTW